MTTIIKNKILNISALFLLVFSISACATANVENTEASDSSILEKINPEEENLTTGNNNPGAESIHEENNSIITDSNNQGTTNSDLNSINNLSGTENSSIESNNLPADNDAADRNKIIAQEEMQIIEEKPEPVVNENAANIIKHENSMFWEITGKDKSGNESKLYVLGTIHLGDDKLFPVPDVIENAYEGSDRIIGELSAESWKLMYPALQTKKSESAKKTAEQIKKTGKALSDYLTAEQTAYLLKYVSSKEVLNKYEPWFFTWELSSLPINISGLDATKSYDVYFIGKSINEDRNMEGLDSLEEQLQDLSYGSWETQFAMLQDLLNDLIADSEGFGQFTLEMYQAYLTSDEEKLSKIVNSNTKELSSAYGEDYHNDIFVSKNEKWAKQFEEYLSEGGTTFVFAGCGHFLGDDSVFKIMQDNGTLNY